MAAHFRRFRVATGVSGHHRTLELIAAIILRLQMGVSDTQLGRPRQRRAVQFSAVDLSIAQPG